MNSNQSINKPITVLPLFKVNNYFTHLVTLYFTNAVKLTHMVTWLHKPDIDEYLIVIYNKLNFMFNGQKN